MANTQRDQHATAELLDYVEFSADGRLAYVDSHVADEGQMLALALAALRSMDDDGARAALLVLRA